MSAVRRFLASALHSPRTRLRRLRATLVLLAVTTACGGDSAGETEGAESGVAIGAPGSDAAMAVNDAGTLPNGPASCDLSGIWIARMNGETSALGAQYPNTWYYFEFAQRETELEVTRHMDCGIEVRGTATVQLTPETQRALLTRNVQTGRKGTVRLENGSCAFELERFWSVRGVAESRYLPMPRNRVATLATVQGENPLPSRDQAAMTEDWDGDGQPGISWQISGIVSGSRGSAQRDWTRYFTAPGYTLPATSDFGSANHVIRAEFEAEEVVYTASSPGLDLQAQVNAQAEHTLTLRFLGRTREDPRAQAVIKASDFDTCVAVRAELPAVRGLR